MGPRGVGPCCFDRPSHGFCGCSPAVGLVGRPVVAQHPPALNALAVEPGHRTAQEAHRGRPLLVASSRAAALTAVTGDPVPNTVEPGQRSLLRRSLRPGVGMDQLARLLPLVAVQRRSLPCRSASRFGSRFRSRRRPRRRIARARVVIGTSSSRAILLRVHRWCLGSTACGRCCGSGVRRWVRRTLRRSASAAGPPARKRASHFRAVRSLIPCSAAR